MLLKIEQIIKRSLYLILSIYFTQTLFASSDSSIHPESFDEENQLVEQVNLEIVDIVRSDSSRLSCLCTSLQALQGSIMSEKASCQISSKKTCSVCLEPIEELASENNIEVTPCLHRFHKECLAEAFKSSIENKRSITCPGHEHCQSKLVLADVEILVSTDEKTSISLGLLEESIKGNPNLRLCPSCKGFVVKQEDSSWVAQCKCCEKIICFNCGKDHTKKQSCFEVNEEVLSVYRAAKEADANLVWKVCPHCTFPQDRQSGCDTMRCGHNNYGEQFTAKDYGCGRRFNWSLAETFLKNSDQSGNRNHSLCRNSKKAICSTLFTGVSLGSLIYCGIKSTNLSHINYREKSKYCDTKFPNIDEQCIDFMCLSAHNMTVEDYLACSNNIVCWNDGDNKYSICEDKTCLDYQFRCKKYEDFFEDENCNSYIYSCEHDVEKYDAGFFAAACLSPSLLVCDFFLWKASYYGYY